MNTFHKVSCTNKERTCNIIRPYSELELYLENPFTDNNYSENERKEMKTVLNNKCKFNNGVKGECCDPYDSELEKLNVPSNIKSKFPKIKVINKRNNEKAYKICTNGNCTGYRAPNVYEMCKLKKALIDQNDIAVNLTPDCLQANCNNTQIKTFLNKNEMENPEEHIIDLELINIVKNDDIGKLREFRDNTVFNKVLAAGYPGNTLLHESVYRKSKQCTYYLLEKVDRKILEYKNIDGNTPFHIACLKEDKEIVNTLLKIGCNRFTKNKYGDTPLHSSIRTGNEEIVRFLLYNGCSLFDKNRNGETPLFTSVTTTNKNLKIIKLLCENGSDLLTTNTFGNTCLKEINIDSEESVEDLSFEDKEIETYLIQSVYNTYKNNDAEYKNILFKYPEFSPYETLTEDDKHTKKDVENIKVIYDEQIDNEELYNNKFEKPKKILPNSAKKYLMKNTIEHFESSIKNDYSVKKWNVFYGLILILLLISLVLSFKY